MEPEGSSPHSQAPATYPYPEPAPLVKTVWMMASVPAYPQRDSSVPWQFLQKFLGIALKCRRYQKSKQEKEGEIEISSPRQPTVAYTPTRQSTVHHQLTNCGVTYEMVPECEPQLCGDFQNDSAKHFNHTVFWRSPEKRELTNELTN
jgi:hypothetical protein